MTGWLLDTNVLSEWRRIKPERRVVDFNATRAPSSLFVSEVTFAEIRFGIELVSDAARRSDLHEWLTLKRRPMFEQRVPPLTEDIMLKRRLLVEKGGGSGHTHSQPDLFIATTAAHHGLTVVTRDTSEYATAAVPVINPWHGASRARR